MERRAGELGEQVSAPGYGEQVAAPD